MMADGERVEVRIPVIGKRIEDRQGNVLCRFDAALVDGWIAADRARQGALPVELGPFFRRDPSGLIGVAEDLRLEGDDLVCSVPVSAFIPRCRHGHRECCAAQSPNRLALVLRLPDAPDADGKMIPELIALLPTAGVDIAVFVVDWPPSKETL